MIQQKRQSLPHLTTESIEISESNMGYFDSRDAEEKYRNSYARNKVILRIDIFNMLNAFSEEMLKEARDVIFYLVSKEGTTDWTAKAMNTLYLEDRVFRRYIGELYYFKSPLSVTSLYSDFIDDFKSRYIAMYNDVDTKVSKRRGRICLEDRGYVYIAIPDEYNFEFKLPKEYELEVISRAKNWKGLS